MAEVLFRHRAGASAGGEEVHVHSAGLITEGEAATPFAIAVMGHRGLELSPHVSRKLTPELIAGADLVIGMARRHVAEVCVLVPDAWGRSFTLKELVRRGEEVGPRRAGQSLGEWLADVHWGRTRRDLIGRSTTDDIADPVGKPKAVYEATAAELEDLLDRRAHLLWSRAGEEAPQRGGAATGWWQP